MDVSLFFNNLDYYVLAKYPTCTVITNTFRVSTYDAKRKQRMVISNDILEYLITE